MDGTIVRRSRRVWLRLSDHAPNRHLLTTGLRQFVLAILLIGIYTLGNAALMLQWFLGRVEAPTAVAAVGNIGVFVGAAVAYYFASKNC